MKRGTSEKQEELDNRVIKKKHKMEKRWDV